MSTLDYKPEQTKELLYKELLHNLSKISLQDLLNEDKRGINRDIDSVNENKRLVAFFQRMKRKSRKPQTEIEFSFDQYYSEC